MVTSQVHLLYRALLFVLLFSAAIPLLEAQTVTSPYLNDPDRAIGYVDSCARFWMKAYDSVQGGFYMNIDRTGNLISAWGTGKNTLNQSRDAYGFLRAYQLTGNQEYLIYARRALDFLYRSGWDNTHGGWYNEVNRFGVPSNPGAEKTAYYQHYAMLGITAAVEVMDDSLDRAWLMRSLAHMDSHFWDARPDRFGYYDRTAANGSNPAGKSFNATVDAVTTHLLSLYLMTRDSVYLVRLQKVADNMVNRLAASAATQAIGFVEGYDTNWNPDPANTMTIMGHMLKTAWCLGRLNPVIRNYAQVAVAEQLVESVLQKGYDHQNGGPYKDYDRGSGQMLMWGQADTAKAWWQMEQAVTAGLMLDYLTEKPGAPYLKMADETLNSFMTHFVDHQYGEVYENRTKYGAQIWDTNKGSSGKAAYHSTELGYYVYLYGNLLVNRKFATLHYFFKPVDHNRVVLLDPISVPTMITSVTLDGVDFSRHAGSLANTLVIPANVGGDFAVTFFLRITDVGKSESALIPDQMQLGQNYPNPFNPTTSIRFELPREGSVTLKVYDMLGRVVATPVDGRLVAGTHTIGFDGSRLASGSYLYRLETGGVRLTRRMLLMK